MKLFLLTAAVVAFCVLALSVSILFKKNGQFPDGEIEHNKALRKQGIRCAKMEERKLWGPSRRRTGTGTCAEEDCGDCRASCLRQEINHLQTKDQNLT